LPPTHAAEPRRTSLDREVLALALALPAAGSGLSLLLTTWIDTWWVARLEAPDEPLAAVSIATFTVWIFGAIAALVGMGVTALVARYEGAGKSAAAAYVAYQGVLGALALGAVAALLGSSLRSSTRSWKATRR